MSDLLKRLIKHPAVYALTPSFIKKSIRQLIPTTSYIDAVWAKENKFINTPYEWSYEFNSKFRIGIFFDFSHYHANYIASCIDLKISYKVIKLHSNNWQKEIESSNCDAFLVWPSVFNTVWKKMFDDRLYFLTHYARKIIFPDFESLWIYENKSRVREFLLKNNLPHPKTDIFYSYAECMEFLHSTSYPIVLKIDQAASSHGVWILHNKKKAKKIVNKIFTKGILVKRGDSRDRRWGQVILQQYLPDVDEWRLVRIGDTYFSRKKHRKGDFHSGSGMVSWAQPPLNLLELTKTLTDQFDFKSVAIDFFIDKKNEIFINEIQALFGGIEEVNLNRNSEFMGKYTWINSQWEFTPGFFYNNACANLRLEYLLEKLNKLID